MQGAPPCPGAARAPPSRAPRAPRAGFPPPAPGLPQAYGALRPTSSCLRPAGAPAWLLRHPCDLPGSRSSSAPAPPAPQARLRRLCPRTAALAAAASRDWLPPRACGPLWARTCSGRGRPGLVTAVTSALGAGRWAPAGRGPLAAAPSPGCCPDLVVAPRSCAGPPDGHWRIKA